MLRIAQDCAAKGHQVTIYTGKWRGKWPADNIRVVLLKSRGVLNHQRHQSLINAMKHSILADKPDLVVGFNRMPGLDVYYAADPCFAERARKERSWFYRLTGRYRFFSKCERAVFEIKSRCRILLLTPRDKLIFQHWYATPVERFYEIPPSIPLHKFVGLDRGSARESLRKEFKLPPDAFVVIHVGSAYIRKGLDRVIEGVAKLPTILQKNTWILSVGEDDEEPMRRLAQQFAVADHLIVSGGRSDVPELMMGSDLLAHPARSELAGLVIIEAMTAGIPLIVTKVCGYAQHVENSGAGIVLQEPYVQVDFDQALMQVITTNNTEHWGAAGQAYVTKIKSQNSSTFEADLLENFIAENRAEA